jgi:hypothetical protein
VPGNILAAVLQSPPYTSFSASLQRADLEHPADA